MPARTPTGKPRVGEQSNQPNIRTIDVTFTGSRIVDPGLRIKRGAVYDLIPYKVLSSIYLDAGAAAAEESQRISVVQNADGTFTLFSERLDPADVTAPMQWIPATGACSVRVTFMITG